MIPTKNEEDYLPDVLASIKNQTLQPDEIIIADDASTDKTRKIAKDAGARIVKGGMPGAARNHGAKVATGDLILFLDADVELRDKTFLKEIVKEFVKRRLDIAAPDVVPIDGNKFDKFAHEVYNAYVRLIGRLRAHAPGFCILVKKSIHNQIKGFDETIIFAEDHDYANRAKKIGRFGFLSKTVPIHVSTRRMVRDGRLRMVLTYLLAEVHIWVFGPIRHNAFRYTFGHDKKSK